MIEPIRALKLIAALVLMTLLLTSCRGAAGEHVAHTGHAAQTAASVPAGDFSVYDLESDWTDQSGTAVNIRSLAGRPRVIALVYTHCAYACPRIVSDMKRIEAQLGADGVDAGYVLVSIDPARDTPARLQEFANATRLDPAQWTLLSGTEDTVLELAALLGVRYRRVSDTDFEHSNVITLVDPTGRILYRQTGLGADPAPLVAALRLESAEGWFTAEAPSTPR